MRLNSSNSVSAMNGQRPYTKQYNVTPSAQMSIAFVIGGRGAYPCPEQMDMVPVGVVGLVLGVGGEMINDVWDAVESAGDIAGENSPKVHTHQIT